MQNRPVTLLNMTVDIINNRVNEIGSQAEKFKALK